MFFRFAGMIPLNRDFDKYLGVFHRLKLNCHLTLKEADPFLHTENAHPFCGGGYKLLRLYFKPLPLSSMQRMMFGDDPSSRNEASDRYLLLLLMFRHGLRVWKRADLSFCKLAPQLACCMSPP